MSACETAADFRAICAGERTVGEPDQRQHWALPHHKQPGAGPNAAGVRNALSRLPQTQGLKNREAAESHLEAHMREINPERESEERTASFDGATTTEGGANINVTVPLDEWQALNQKAGRKLSAANAAKVRAIRDIADELLELLEDVEVESEGKANGEEPDEANPEESGPNRDLRVRLAALGQ